MTWSSAHIEEKEETNAKYRETQPNKIRGLSSYNRVSPGKIHISVDYRNECLHIFLDSAKDLAGKRSQDPYAICYLMGNDKRCYFQIENNQTNNETDVFKQNLNPTFQHQFKFRMSLMDINQMSLVVAIWDKDSKSADDYMAGFRLSLKDVQYFQNRDLVWLELKHQEKDGHPAEITAKENFGLVLGSWDLKTCNNHLVAFIDRARVLAEAYEIKGSLPSTLMERTSLMPPDASRLFDEEIIRLQRVISLGRSKMDDRRGERDNLKTENSHLNAAYIQNQHTLKERQSTLYSLEIRESQVSGKVIGLDHLIEQIRILEMKIASERQRVEKGRTSWQEIGQVQAVALEVQSLGGINIGESKYEEEKQKIEILIRNEFLEKMKQALERARQSYRLKYEEFIRKIERDASEIMKLYEEIIIERSQKGADKKNSLLNLERSRAYQLRINQLMADISGFDSKIRFLEGKVGDLDEEYREQMLHLDSDLAALKQKLSDLFIKLSAFAQTDNEIIIFNKLLSCEEIRLAESLTRVQRKVTVSESVVRGSHAADVTITGGLSSACSHGYSVQSGIKSQRRESGYSSPEDAPTTVHGGGMDVFDFPQGVSNGEQRLSTRNSRKYETGDQEYRMSSSTIRSSRNSTQSDIFDSIRGDIL